MNESEKENVCVAFVSEKQHEGELKRLLRKPMGSWHSLAKFIGARDVDISDVFVTWLMEPCSEDKAFRLILFYGSEGGSMTASVNEERLFRGSELRKGGG